MPTILRADSTYTSLYRSAYARLLGESFRNGRAPRRDACGGEAGTLRYVGCGEDSSFWRGMTLRYSRGGFVLSLSVVFEAGMLPPTPAYYMRVKGGNRDASFGPHRIVGL